MSGKPVLNHECPQAIEVLTVYGRETLSDIDYWEISQTGVLTIYASDALIAEFASGAWYAIRNMEYYIYDK